jgi:hypothetical protein
MEAFTFSGPKLAGHLDRSSSLEVQQRRSPPISFVANDIVTAKEAERLTVESVFPLLTSS